MRNQKTFIAKQVRKSVSNFAVLAILFGGAIATAAQTQAYPPKKTVPTEIHPRLFVLANPVVEGQWKTSLDLVNAPTDLMQIESGQCIRFGIFATGDDRAQLLNSAKMGFVVSYAGHEENFAAERSQVIKQVKPEGGDLAAEALAAGGIKNPMSSMVSLAVPPAQWCAPPEGPDGSLTIHATVTGADGKKFEPALRSIEVKTYATARKNPPFKDIETFSVWVQRYHFAPEPAQLLIAIRIIASDESSMQKPNLMEFFVAALKADPDAAKELLRALPAESPFVRAYCIPVLKEAGYPTSALLNEFPAELRPEIDAIHLPDPFDMKADENLPNRMDMLWTIFFATGKIEPVRAIASMLAWQPDFRKLQEIQKSGQKPKEITESIMRGAVYSGAGWSLNSLSRTDGVVADYVDALRASPDTPGFVREQLAHLHVNPAFNPNLQK